MGFSSLFANCIFGATYRSIEKIYEVSWMDADKVVRNAEEEMIHDSVIKD